MLVRDKGMFMKGLLLMASFLAVFVTIFLPVFPGNQNGLMYADELFNKLSKGSSYFIPEIQESVSAYQGKALDLTSDFKKPQVPDGVKDKMKADAAAAMAAQMLGKAGFQATVAGDRLTLNADIAALANEALAVSDKLFQNDADSVTAKYGMDGKLVGALWWNVLAGMIKPLQKEKHVAEASALNLVVTKGIEPAYNFYGVQAESVMSKIVVLVALLAFYVIYTMWYGYAIFDIFGGIGLSMKKAKVKKEM